MLVRLALARAPHWTRIVSTIVASLTPEGIHDSLHESLSSTSEVAFGPVGRRFRPVHSVAPRAPGGSFVQDLCNSLEIYGDPVTVSSSGTNVRLAVPEAGIPAALCPAEGIRRRLAERRRGRVARGSLTLGRSQNRA